MSFKNVYYQFKGENVQRYADISAFNKFLTEKQIIFDFPSNNNLDDLFVLLDRDENVIMLMAYKQGSSNVYHSFRINPAVGALNFINDIMLCALLTQYHQDDNTYCLTFTDKVDKQLKIDNYYNFIEKNGNFLKQIIRIDKGSAVDCNIVFKEGISSINTTPCELKNAELRDLGNHDFKAVCDLEKIKNYLDIGSIGFYPEKINVILDTKNSVIALLFEKNGQMTAGFQKFEELNVCDPIDITELVKLYFSCPQYSNYLFPKKSELIEKIPQEVLVGAYGVFDFMIVAIKKGYIMDREYSIVSV
jgi:hypothetical protein